MPLIVTKSGEPLSFSSKNPPTFSQLEGIEDLLTDEQLTSTDLYTIFLMYGPEHNREKEEILNIVERNYQFNENASDINKLYMLAFYIDRLMYLKNKIKQKEVEVIFRATDNLNNFEKNNLDYMLKNFYSFVKYVTDISEQNNYTKKANELLKSNVKHRLFESLKGFYFLLNDDLDKSMFLFSQDKNRVSEAGIVICRKIKNEKHDENEYKIFMKERNTMENVLDKIEYIIDIFKRQTEFDLDEIKNFKEQVLKLESFYENKNFTSYINFYLGKLHHIKKDYITAQEYYEKSNEPVAINNYMIITRKIINDDSKYQNIINYINFLDNNINKIIVNETNHIDEKTKEINKIYKIKKEENWCVSALKNYFELIENELVDQKIVWNNIACFYSKCIEECEIEAIKNFYIQLKKKYGDATKEYESTILKNGLYHIQNSFNNKENELIMYYCNCIIFKMLCSFNDDVCSYNSSFFVKKEKSLEILDKINSEFETCNMYIALLLEDINFTKTSNGISYQNRLIILGNLYRKNNLYEESNKIFYELINTNIEINSEIFAVYNLGLNNLMIYKKTKNFDYLNESQKIFITGLKKYKNSYYLVLGFLLRLYECKKYNEILILKKKLQKDLSRINTCHGQEASKFFNLIIGLTNLCLNNISESIEYISNCGNEEIINNFRNCYN
ncbi:hypothetical protein COBT_001106 [Conglomerata obtusa]